VKKIAESQGASATSALELLREQHRIATLMIVGISSLAGIVGCVPGIQSAGLLAGSGVFLLSASSQVALLYVSFLPKFAHR
jgi:hypothetical protein